MQLEPSNTVLELTDKKGGIPTILAFLEDLELIKVADNSDLGLKAM